MIQRRLRTLLLCANLLASCSTVVLAADTITGVVRNQTRGGISTGDEVVLLRLDQSEEARTKTDSQGSFTLNVRYPGVPHLVRVVHQGVNHDRRVSAGDAVSIDVFDTAAQVKAVTGNIEIIRIATNGNVLHVSDMVEVENNSNPPLTQAGERTFEVYLPAHARLDSVLAASSGSRASSEKVGAMISATPVPGEPGHYSVDFPLRPGATRFIFNYELPYDGHAAFRPKSVYPVQQLAVMIPPTMKFVPRSTAFHVLRTGNNSYQVESATRVEAGEGPGFEISGSGALPSLPAYVQSLPKAAVVVPTPAISTPGNSGARGHSVSGAISETVLSSPSRVHPGVLVGSVLLVLGSCAFLLRRRQHLSAKTMATALERSKQTRQRPASLVNALGEELFQLEVDRLNGTISREEYASARQALERTVKRAVARTGVGVGTATPPDGCAEQET
jgi:hypothetical protein